MSLSEIVSDVVSILKVFSGPFWVMLTLGVATTIARKFIVLSVPESTTSESDHVSSYCEHIEGTDTYYDPSDYDYIENQ